MNPNFCRALVERRPVGVPSSVQLGVGSPPGPTLPSPEPLSNVPLLLYPGAGEPPYYDAYAGVFPYVPLAGAFGVYDYPFEPAFIQKRNERERQRVKCVNEGYARLRGHLPGALAEKRLSKVETLRAAIRYIKYLQELLGAAPDSAPPAAARASSPPPARPGPGDAPPRSEAAGSSGSASAPFLESGESGQ